jgi:pimeloyl-ACP methyl ester carboxylesterase
MPRLVFVHSPLVGPMTWKRTAERFAARGYSVATPSLRSVDDGPPYYSKFAAAICEAIGVGASGHAILIGHSGAGALLPVIADAVPGVKAMIFVDAVLPHPGRSWFDTAPNQLAEQLRGLAQEGRLPPWHEWFPPEMLHALIPDGEMLARFTAEIPRTPLAYFEELAPTTGTLGQCAYLQLSEAYEETAKEAERQGWTTIRQPMNHLAMLTDPGEVSNLLGRLVETLLGSDH